MHDTKTSPELELRHRKYKEVLENLTIMSDMFMRNVFKKRECTEYVLQIIMGDKDLKVLEQVIQKDYKNLQGRSAVLDCVVVDAQGKQYDVEIQQESLGASPKRARYHSGLMDMNSLNEGESYDKLPETYVIFITLKDVLGFGLPIYHIERRIREADVDFGDKSYIIYVNSAVQDDTELGRLMHDFHCKKAEDMHSEILAKRVNELKETTGGVEYMCRELKIMMDTMYSEGEKQGKNKGIMEGEIKAKRETAHIMSEKNMPLPVIADVLKVSESQVEEWLSEAVTLA